MWIVGVDENGMGPRLDPLIATAVTLELRGYDRARLRRRGLEQGVGDSKQTSAFGQMKAAESLALALGARALGHVPEDADALLAALGLDTPATLQERCPSAAQRAQCWGPLTLPAFGGSLAEGEERLAALEGRTLRVHRVRTRAVCVRELNDALAAGQNKLAVDLELFERLLLDARAAGDGDLLAHCGIMGGLRRYVPRFRHFGQPSLANGLTLAEPVRVLEEVKGCSRYAVPALGEVSFEVKADDRHLAVGLASMVGKYVRELAMARIVGFYRALDPELPAASGYHDPVTARFVDGVAARRRRLALVDACFVREG